MTAHPTSKLYAAENFVMRQLVALPHDGLVEVFGSRLPVPAELRFDDLHAVRGYVDALADEIGIGQPRVRIRKGRKAAHYEPAHATIAIPRVTEVIGTDWAMRETVILHEFAHHLSHARRVDFDHGPGYAACLLEVVRRRMGHVAEMMYREAFDNAGVQVTESVVQ